MIELKSEPTAWFAELGVCDEAGCYWGETVRRVPCETEAEAQKVIDEWLSAEKLEMPSLDKLGPEADFFMCRIHRVDYVVAARTDAAAPPQPAADDMTRPGDVVHDT